jgi:hypothetical protein
MRENLWQTDSRIGIHGRCMSRERGAFSQQLLALAYCDDRFVCSVALVAGASGLSLTVIRCVLATKVSVSRVASSHLVGNIERNGCLGL